MAKQQLIISWTFLCARQKPRIGSLITLTLLLSLRLAFANAAVLHILEKVARYSQTFMQAQILLFRCHELERKNSKLNVKMNSESKDSFIHVQLFFHLDPTLNPT